MKRIAVAALSVFLIGCDGEDTTPKTNTAPTVQQRSNPLESTAKDIDAAAKTAGDQAKDAARDLQSDAASARDQTTAAAQDAANMGEKEANQKLDQVLQLINQKKLDQAEPLLASVEKVKDRLPAAVQQKLVTVRQALDRARTQP